MQLFIFLSVVQNAFAFLLLMLHVLLFCTHNLMCICRLSFLFGKLLFLSLANLVDLKQMILGNS